ncbi:hypothetical protein C8J57DRAFT_1258063 [Mycena rebaudengoi]|nr:hypothetical protein C8J57DRAFT_1258063 [Mycena rebaudengoi]
MSPRIGGGVYYKQDEESNPLPRVQMYPLDVTDSMVISFLTLQHYHEIVSRSQRSDSSSICVHPAVSIPELGALITGIPRSGELLEDPIQTQCLNSGASKRFVWSILRCGIALHFLVLKQLICLLGAWLALSIGCLASLARSPDEVGVFKRYGTRCETLSPTEWKVNIQLARVGLEVAVKVGRNQVDAGGSSGGDSITSAVGKTGKMNEKPKTVS